MPDLDLVTADSERRAFTLLHAARTVQISLGRPGGLDIAPCAGRVRVVDAKYAEWWEPPVLGAVPRHALRFVVTLPGVTILADDRVSTLGRRLTTAPTAVLVRPDGDVAWVGEATRAGLDAALGMWCGVGAEA